MDQPLISVIVPVHNVEAYLNECVDSIVGQTWKNLEIILVDDGSTDKSGVICDDYAAKDARVVVVHKEQGGVSSARNAGLDIAKGDFIGFVDSDDYIATNMYERLYAGFSSAVAKDFDVKAVNATGVILYFEKKEKFKIMRPGDWLRKKDTLVPPSEMVRIFLSDSTNHFVCAKLFSKEIFATLRFKNGIVDEDSLLMYQASVLMRNNGWAMVEIPCVAYWYRQREGSICHSKDTLLRLDRMDNIAAIMEEVKHDPELTAFVTMQRARTLVLLVNDIMRSREWTRKYFKTYFNLLRAVPRKTMKQACSKSIYAKYRKTMLFPHLRMLELRLRAASV